MRRYSAPRAAEPSLTAVVPELKLRFLTKLIKYQELVSKSFSALVIKSFRMVVFSSRPHLGRLCTWDHDGLVANMHLGPKSLKFEPSHSAANYCQN
jgi:hypothetical protein